jgi:hypothetical protein
VKEPATNGNKSLNELIEHVTSDKIVTWGWNPGPGRSVPPLSHQQFVVAFKTWAAAGAPCPVNHLPTRLQDGFHRFEFAFHPVGLATRISGGLPHPGRPAAFRRNSPKSTGRTLLKIQSARKIVTRMAGTAEGAALHRANTRYLVIPVSCLRKSAAECRESH